MKRSMSSRGETEREIDEKCEVIINRGDEEVRKFKR